MQKSDLKTLMEAHRAALQATSENACWAAGHKATILLVEQAVTASGGAQPYSPIGLLGGVDKSGQQSIWSKLAPLLLP